MGDWRQEGLQGVVEPLLDWYDRARRTLPWREDPQPYRVWISEIMLQQTRVDTVIPYFERFMATFPTIEDLANGPVDEVLRLWSGLGYYSRARNLHRCAQVVRDEWEGKLPATVKELVTLPGIGRYTAGAISSIAFGQQASLLDGNVIRVFSRWTDLGLEVGQTVTKRMLWQWADDLVPRKRPGDFNQALMELGALVCTPRNPSCDTCPVRGTCVALREGTVALRPVKAKKKKAKVVEVRAAVIRNDKGELLLFQRPPTGLFGGLWECFQQEGLEEVGMEQAIRWVKAELGLTVESAGMPGRGQHVLTHRRMQLLVYPFQLTSGVLAETPGQYQGWKWVQEDQLDTLGVGALTGKMLSLLSGQGELNFGG